jgi:hypothetical protein
VGSIINILGIDPGEFKSIRRPLDPQTNATKSYFGWQDAGAPEEHGLGRGDKGHSLDERILRFQNSLLGIDLGNVNHDTGLAA